ncbi:MAG: nucleotidyltransferase domain-containing protein [Pseudomonadota bacterium]
MNTDQVLRSIVKLIIRCVDPDLVMLFGSVAQGRARVDSDIDLLVVGNFVEPKPLRALELKGLLSSLAVPVDLHLRTPEELEAERRQPFSLIDTTVRYGILLYERGA